MCQKREREREREREKDMLKWCVITHHPKEDNLKMGVSNPSSKIEMVWQWRWPLDNHYCQAFLSFNFNLT